MGIINNTLRTAKAVTISETNLVKINKDEFDKNVFGKGNKQFFGKDVSKSAFGKNLVGKPSFAKPINFGKGDKCDFNKDFYPIVHF